MNCPAMPSGGGRGIKFRKPFRPKTRKITPARYPAIAETILITGFSFWIGSLDGANHIDVNMIDGVYLWRIQVFMAKGISEPEHVWLVLIKAMRALARYASASIKETGLGDSDFR